MFTLGSSTPLYARSGNAAFLVDNVGDLKRACKQLKVIQDTLKATEPVIIPTSVRSTYIVDIARALEHEVDRSSRLRRDNVTPCAEYTVKYDPDTRTQTRIGAQIVEDLLTDSKELNARALKAFKAVLLF